MKSPILLMSGISTSDPNTGAISIPTCTASIQGTSTNPNEKILLPITHIWVGDPCTFTATCIIEDTDGNEVYKEEYPEAIIQELGQMVYCRRDVPMPWQSAQYTVKIIIRQNNEESVQQEWPLLISEASPIILPSNGNASNISRLRLH